jgi:hypothetical protein
MPFFSLFQTNMLVAGRAFDGSTSLLNAYERLTYLAGNASWFTEFRPIHSYFFPHLKRLLRIFLKHNICCHISGSYATYLAGVTNSFRGVSLYITIRDTQILNLIFRRGEGRDTFDVDDFSFSLVDEYVDLNVFAYRVWSGAHFSVLLYCFGVGASRICGSRSSMDFVRFVWDNFESFHFRKYSLVFVPSPSPEGRLVCLKYYRAASDGWKDCAQCDFCVNEYSNILRPCTSCKGLTTCSCNICHRQPPTLLSMATRIAIMLQP